MRNLKITQRLLYMAIMFTLVACHGTAKLPYAVGKGKILDEFDITIVDKNIKLKQGQEFSLAVLGLEAGKKDWTWNAAKTENEYRELDRTKYPYYNITIDKGGKTFFGRLLFLQQSKSAYKEATSRFYELKIPAQAFERSKNGRVASVYDYIPDHGKKAAKKAIKPNWIILLSDSSF